jgi:hypothetical protein
MKPVRGRTFAFQKPRRRQDECTRAHGGNTLGAISYFTELFEQRRARQPALIVTSHNEGVAGQVLEWTRLHSEALRRHHRAGLGGNNAKVVNRVAVRQIRVLEHRRDRERQRLEIRIYNESDCMHDG